MIQYHTRPFTLLEFKIEVTHRCHLNCIHCSSDAQPSNLNEMSLDNCHRILTEASTLGAKKVAFSGGEPLCWPHICDVVDTAAKNSLEITIYTSGNTDNFEKKAKSIYQLGAKAFIFSIFGGTATSHERVTRVVGSFNKTLSAMEESKNIGLMTELHFVPMSTNYRELKDIATLGMRYGTTVLSVLRMVPQGRAALLRGRTLNRIQNLGLRRQIRQLRANGFNIRTGSPYNFLMLSDSPKCCAAIDRFIIGPDLRLYPCDAFKQVKAEELVGTLDYSYLNESCIRVCWEKSPYFEAIRTYLTTPFKDPCDSCRLLEKCLSGCLAQKVVAYGDLGKRPDPDCLAGNIQGV